MITQTLGKYLNQIIDVVTAFDGDIVKFLGDAVLVTFESKNLNDSSKYDTNLRATLCCLRILSEYSEFEVSFDDIADTTSGTIVRRRSLKHDGNGKTMLYLHLAITAGDMSRKKVKLNNFTDTEASKLIVEQQSAAESRLAKFVNQSLWRSFVSRKTRKLSVPSEFSEIERSRTLGQFRLVTIVFVKLKFDFNVQLSQIAIAGFLKCLKKYEVDDKGQTLLGVFGLPPFAHPNEPEQALKAAIEFEAIAQQKLEGKVSIGLSTGDILFASLGTACRQEAGLLGDVVNIAARLMSIAYPHGSILVDEVTHQGSINSFVHTDIGEHYIKGKDMPLRLWSISAHTFHGPNTEGIYGYNEEKSVILDKYTQWKESKRESILFVEAASGLGKSTLGTFASNLAVNHDIPVCLIQGTEIEQRTPYFGAGGIMSFIYTQFKNMKNTHKKHYTDVIKDDGSLSASKLDLISRMTGARTPSRRSSIAGSNDAVDFTTLEGIEKLSNDFMTYHGENLTLAPLLGMVIPSLKVPDKQQTAKLDSQAKNNLLKTLILRIFNSYVSKHECLFVLDDSQWLDDMSLAILMTLIKFSQKEFIIILSRPVSSSGSEVLNQISQHPKVERLELRGLSKQAVEEIIVNRCTETTRQVISVESALLDAIIQKGSRFPLYTDMIGSLLQDKVGNELTIDDCGCLRLKDAEIKIDDILLDTVGAAIISQFDRLPPSFQEILRIACCLGQYFKLDDVLEVGGLDITTLEAFAIISENDRYNFLEIIIHHPSTITLAGDNGETVYNCSFRHISIMNAIYESLSYADRVSLNLTAARRFESMLTGENEDIILPIMSFHYARTLDYEKDMWCLETLGCKYVLRYAFVEGAKTLTRLEEIYQTLDVDKRNQINQLRRAHWLAETSWAWVQLKKMEECQNTAFQALNLIQSEPWPRNEPDVQRMFKKSLVRFLRLWLLTLGGRRKRSSIEDRKNSFKKVTPTSAKEISEVNLSTTETITLSRNSIRERCLSSLIVVPIFDPTFMKAMSALIMIELLCHVIIRATEDPVTWRVYLGRATFMFYFPARALAKIFFRRLLQEESNREPIPNIHYLQLTCVMVMMTPPFYSSRTYINGYAR
ncbi:hypothetical protein HDU76_011075 [Blyttiomyces sp. JEL0837]|nr:hypothetical protein HDU76_011075 [Blyttiomyces sp. JEL0837]